MPQQLDARQNNGGRQKTKRKNNAYLQQRDSKPEKNEWSTNRQCLTIHKKQLLLDNILESMWQLPRTTKNKERIGEYFAKL